MWSHAVSPAAGARHHCDWIWPPQMMRCVVLGCPAGRGAAHAFSRVTQRRAQRHAPTATLGSDIPWLPVCAVKMSAQVKQAVLEVEEYIRREGWPAIPHDIMKVTLHASMRWESSRWCARVVAAPASSRTGPFLPPPLQQQLCAGCMRTEGTTALEPGCTFCHCAVRGWLADCGVPSMLHRTPSGAPA